MTVRVGVIGTGIMGADHARILNRDVPGCEITLLSDLDTDRAQAIADEIPSATVVTDAHELINSPVVDAVLIASSDATHVEYVTACLAVGKPVLSEKPLAPTAVECQSLLEAEQTIIGSGNPLISVGFMRRFDPGYVELKEMLQQGELGAPLLVHSTARGVSAPAGSDEFTITGSAIHDIDITPWLLESPITDVAWMAPRRSPDVHDRQDPQFILMRTAEGVLITVDVFLNARYGYDIRCEVVGSQSTAGLTEPQRVVHDGGLRRSTSYAADWRPRFAEAYRLQSRAWINSIRHRTRTPLATAVDGLNAALVADAVIASMRNGGAWTAVKR